MNTDFTYPASGMPGWYLSVDNDDYYQWDYRPDLKGATHVSLFYNKLTRSKEALEKFPHTWDIIIHNGQAEVTPLPNTILSLEEAQATAIATWRMS